VLLLGTIACSCSRDDTSEPALPEAAPEQNSVVVYAAYDDKTYLPALFNRFTQATGIVVIVRNGEVPGIIDDVILNRATPPADVLITPSAGGAGSSLS
jgi:hypothetical protein